MNLFSFSSFFKKKKKHLTVPDTILIKKLKKLSSQSDLHVYKNIKIYHHKDAYTIPLIVMDELRGIYLFETKEWTFDELKNSKIEKAEHQDASENTLAFENTQSIIQKKFNELTHHDGVPIFNFLLMENLNASEYEHLDSSFKELLPQEKIIFCDATEADIFKKLQEVSDEKENLLEFDMILNTLFIQYAILGEHSTFNHATENQKEFIDKEMQGVIELSGNYASGKSSTLLLKAIVELFNKNAKKIIILKPSTLACDILKKKLLEIVEHAIIEVDLTDIEIITPVELINRHLHKLKKEKVHNIIIHPKLMKKSFDASEIIMCDDASLYPIEFIEYLKHIQKKSHLVLVKTDVESSQLQTNFRTQKQEVHFYKTKPHAKAMQLISSYTQKQDEKILLVGNSLSIKKLKDDLDLYITNSIIILESSSSLINQNFNNLLLCTYSDTNELKVDHIILMDLCFTSENEIEYAFNLSTKSVNILYEEDCTEVKNLRIKYEPSTQE